MRELAPGLQQPARPPAFAPTRPAAHLARPQACNRNNFVCVPLYETLGEDAIEYILGHSEARLVFVQGKRLGRVAKALAAVPRGQVAAVVHWGGGESKDDIKVGRPARGREGASVCGAGTSGSNGLVSCGHVAEPAARPVPQSLAHGSLRHAAAAQRGQALTACTQLVPRLATAAAPPRRQAAAACAPKVVAFGELEAAGGKARVAAPEPPKPEDMSTIMYTSGTTGGCQAGG